MTVKQKELVWFSAPIAGLLRQIGGTFWKAADRVGFPILLFISVMLFIGWSWWWIPLCLSAFAVKTLPITLIGDSFWASWFNPIWVFIMGYFQALPCIFIGIKLKRVVTSLWLPLFPAVVVFLFVLFSNLSFSAQYFDWKWCEFIIGSFVSYPYLQLIRMGRKNGHNLT